jgi:PKD repeat protein
MRRLIVFWMVLLIGGFCFGQNLSLIPSDFACGFNDADYFVPNLQAPPCSVTGNAVAWCDCASIRDTEDPIGSGVRIVKAIIHLVRADDGSCPVSIAALDDYMKEVNKVFKGVYADNHITQYPYLAGSFPSIWTSTLGNYDSGVKFCWEIRTYNESNSLHSSLPSFVLNHGLSFGNELHVVVNFGLLGPGAGYANGSFGKGGHIRYHDVGNPKVLSHEFGHALGLIHPFYAVGCGSALSEHLGLNAAYRDETNDFCGDTDPDRIGWIGGCMQDPTPVCSTASTGLTRWNIMAYAPNIGDCQSVLFSDDQANRMRCFLSNQFGGNLTASIPQPCAAWLITGLEAKPTKSCIGHPIQFYADPGSNGSLVGLSYSWTFGDGGTSNLKNPLHAYQMNGSYTVSLTVSRPNNLSYTYSRPNYINISSTGVAYSQDFDLPSNGYVNDMPTGWERQNIDRRFSSWQRIRNFLFSNDVATLAEPNDKWKVVAGGGQPTWTQVNNYDVINPNGLPGGALAINSTIRESGESGPVTLVNQPGEKDTLLSPVFDLSGIPNPTMRFSFAHVPAANSSGTPCGWNPPYWSSTVTSGANAYGYANLGCPTLPGHTYPVCVENKISVKISTDCGGTWIPLQDQNSRLWDQVYCFDLNTVPGECCPYGFIPQAANAWNNTSFNLCDVSNLGDVRFMFEYEHGANDNFFWIDDFAIQAGASVPWQSAVSISHTDETCNGNLGTVSITLPPPPFFNIGIADNFGNTNVALSTGSHTFTGLHGLPGGSLHHITIRDFSGNCLQLNESIDLIGTLSFSTTVANACPASGGSITINGLGTGLYDIVYQLNGNLVLTASGQSNGFTGAVPIAGTYFVTVSEQGTGNCGSAWVTVGNTGSLPVTANTTFDCATGRGFVQITNPLPPGFVYDILAPNGQVVASSTSGQVPAIGQLGLLPGNYTLSLTGQGNCGSLPITIAIPPASFTATLTPTPTNGCQPPSGTLTVTPSFLGLFEFQLLDLQGLPIGLPIQGNSHTFVGLANGLYRVRITNLSPPFDCILEQQQVGLTTAPAILTALSTTPNLICNGAPNGVLNFSVRGPLSFISNITITNTTTGFTYCNIGQPFTQGAPLTWNPPIPGSGIPFTLTGLPAGQYQINVTHTLGCGSGSIAINNLYPGIPHYTSISNSCHGVGGTITIQIQNPLPGITYTFEVLQGVTQIANVSVLQGNYTFGVPGPGTYTVNVSSSDGRCSSSQVTVTNFGNLSPLYSIAYDCVAGTATVTPTNYTGIGYTFTLYDQFNVALPSLTIPTQGMYTLEVVGFGDCGYITVDASDFSPGWSAAANVTGANCGNNGSVHVTSLPPAFRNYTLVGSLLPSNSSGIFGNLAPGSYDVLVENFSGECELVHFVVPNLGNMPPNAICQNLTAQLDNTGNVVISAAMVNNGSSGACTLTGMTLSPTTFNCNNVGINTTAMLTVSDLNGNTGTCLSTITVQDNTPPVALCQNTTVQIPNSGTITILPSSIDFGSSDACGLAILSVNPNTFTCSNVGSNPVILTVTDVNGNLSTCAATVTVSDITCCDAGQPALVRLIDPIYADFLAISSNGTITQSFVVNGIARIDQPIGQPAITIQGNTMYMGPTARIEVGPNTLLRIGGGAHVEAGCNIMWDGIYLTDPTAVIEVFNATIMDATSGVVSNMGGRFDIRGSNFVNNLWSLKVNTWSVAPHTGRVVGTTFTGSASLPYFPHANQRSLGGIDLFRVTGGITIGSNANNAAANTFQNMNYGIRSQGSNLTCYRNNFSGMVVRTAFTGSGSGIYSRNTLPTVNTSLTVGLPTGNAAGALNQAQNTFTNCVHGIYAQATQNVRVRGNTFTGCSENGVFGTGLSLPQLNRPATALAVERNTFTENHIGLHLNTAMGLVGAVNNNTITGTNGIIRGMQLDGLDYDPLLPATTYPMQVTNNSLSLRGDGFRAMSSKRINFEQNSVYIFHGQALSPLPNNGFYVAGCEYVRIFDNPNIRSNVTAPTLAMRPVRGIFVTMSPNTEVRCNDVADWGRCVVWENECRPSVMMNNSLRNAYDGLVLTGNAFIGQQGAPASPGSQGVVSDNRWALPMVWSWVLSENSDGNQSKFYVKAANNFNPGNVAPRNRISGPGTRMPTQTLIGQMVSYNCTQAGGGTGNGRAIANIANNPITQGVYISETQFRAKQWAFSKLLQDSSLIGTDTVISNFFQQVNPSQLAKLSRVSETIRVQNLQSALALNQSVSASDITEQNWVAVNELIITSMDTAFDGFSPVQTAVLSQIAHQCILSGGKAVLVARTLLGLEGESMWIDDNCSEINAKSEAGSSAESNSLSKSFEIWPNPTEAMLNLLPVLGQEENYEWTISNAHGNAVLKGSLSGRGVSTLDTRTIPAGVYFIRLVDATGRYWQSKFVVVH